MLLCQQKEGDSNGYYINRRLEFKKSNESFIIKKRIISTIIASILLISVFPVVSFAATVNILFRVITRLFQIQYKENLRYSTEETRRLQNIWFILSLNIREMA